MNAQNEIKQALIWLLNNNLITINQYNEYLKKTDKELIEILPKYYQDKVEVIDIRPVEITSVEDLEENQTKYLKINYTDGTSKIYKQNEDNIIAGEMTFATLKNNNETDEQKFFTIFVSNLLEETPTISQTSGVKSSPSKEKTKTHSIQGIASKMFENDGFTNTLFFIFLTGISIGITIMTVLNIIIK